MQEGKIERFKAGIIEYLLKYLKENKIKYYELGKGFKDINYDFYGLIKIIDDTSMPDSEYYLEITINKKKKGDYDGLEKNRSN